MPPRERCWWASLEGADPISLDPLATLPYEPFELRADTKQQTASSDFFDGRLLALYLVSSCRFSHPISRRDLTRDECCALDAHLRRTQASKGISEVARCYDLRTAEAAGSSSVSFSAELAAARRSHELELAEALYRGDGIGRAQPRAQAGSSGSRRTQASRATSQAAPTVVRDGGLTLIDDDAIPTHARGVGRESQQRLAHHARRSNNDRRGPLESFPALPTPSPRPRPPVIPPAAAAAMAARAAAQQAAAAAAVEAEAKAAVAAAAMRDAAYATRARALALARGTADAGSGGDGDDGDDGDGGDGDDGDGGVSMATACARRAELCEAAASASAAFTTEALSLARSQPALVAEIERALDLVVAGTERRRALRPMPRQHRRLVHELSHLYAVGTVAAGVEPQRYVSLLRTEGSTWPEFPLSEAAEITQAAAASKAAVAATAAAATSSACKAAGASDAAAPSTEVAAAGGWAAGGASPCTSHGWPLRLLQVECEERFVTSLLAAHRGHYALAWSPERRRDRQSARERLQLSATLTFATEAAARDVMHTLGGGLRGRFRAERPSWAVPTPAAHEAERVRHVGVQLLLTSIPHATEAGHVAHVGHMGHMGQVCVAVRLSVDALHEAVPPAVTSRRRRRPQKARAAPLAAWTAGPTAERTEWTEAHESIRSRLVDMGFSLPASHRASLHAGPHMGSEDEWLMEAVAWLMSVPEESRDAPIAPEGELPAEDVVTDVAPPPRSVRPSSAEAWPSSSRAVRGTKVSEDAKSKTPNGNRWAALLGTSDSE